MKRLWLFFVMTACVLAFSSTVSSANGGPMLCSSFYDLIAGGGNPESVMDAGDFVVFIEENSNCGGHVGTNTFFYFLGDAPWCFSEIHFDLALDPQSFPNNKGNPTPGKFLINNEFEECIPAAAWCYPDGIFFPFYIAAQAVMQYDGIEESAWAGTCEAANDECEEWGIDFPGKNWATYIFYDGTDCNLPNGD